MSCRGHSFVDNSTGEEVYHDCSYPESIVVNIKKKNVDIDFDESDQEYCISFEGDSDIVKYLIGQLHHIKTVYGGKSERRSSKGTLGNE